MKEFDLDSLSRKMPYEDPGHEFFDNFTEKVMRKSLPRPARVFSLRNILTPVMGIAAAAAVIIVATVSLHNEPQWDYNYIISENIDESVSSFFASLSDEELAYLADEISYNDDFFANLPNE